MRTRTQTFTRPMQVLVIIALILTLVVPLLIPATAGADPKIQPQLLQIVEADPDQTVRIIVQKTRNSQMAEALAVQLGGEIIADLSMIHAFSAEMAAADALQLAKSGAVRWVSLDAGVINTGGPNKCTECIDTTKLLGIYTQAIGATQLWNEPPYLQGQGIGVAVVDSGVNLHNDLSLGKGGGNYRVDTSKVFNSDTRYAVDKYGHGTHIAGIIGGNGNESKGAQIGVAPNVTLYNLKVSDDRGAGSISGVVAALQWVYDNKDAENIRVVNLSLNSSVPESYHTSPLSAAVEILWFNGVVVVVSAGNNGVDDNGVLYPPANDPFVITVGAADDMGTIDIADDVLASFSAYGTTLDGFAKPDLVAPGTDIISLLANNSAELVKGHPSHRVDGFAGGQDHYFRMSGTSMASAVVSGSVALLLQDEPGLTPDQVKFRLMATARPFSGPEPGATGAGYLDIFAAVHGTTTESANTGLVASQLLWSGIDPIAWNSVAWNSVAWNSVAWNSVAWNSVAWNSVAWNSVAWNE